MVCVWLDRVLIVHLFEHDTSLHVIGSEAVSCLGYVSSTIFSSYSWPPTLDYGQPHQQLSCNPIVKIRTHVQTHAHTTDTTKHLLHMYVHTTWQCAFTQAHFTQSMWPMIASWYVLSIIFRACKSEIFSQCHADRWVSISSFLLHAQSCNIRIVPV